MAERRVNTGPAAGLDGGKMTDQLKEAWENAFTIESMPPERWLAARIGEITGAYYIYEFFQDNVGEYWFQTKYRDTGKYTGTGRKFRAREGA